MIGLSSMAGPGARTDALHLRWSHFRTWSLESRAARPSPDRGAVSRAGSVLGGEAGPMERRLEDRAAMVLVVVPGRRSRQRAGAVQALGDDLVAGGDLLGAVEALLAKRSGHEAQLPGVAQ